MAGRRSHVDAWIGGALKAGGAVGVRTAPVYYDYQAMLEHAVDKHDVPPSLVSTRCGRRSTPPCSLVDPGGQRHFDMDGEPVVLVVVNNLTRELHKQEAEVWKRMIRIMAHELNKTAPPRTKARASG